MPYKDKEAYKTYHREYARKLRNTKLENQRPRKEVFQGYFIICSKCSKVLKLHMKSIVSKNSTMCQECYYESLQENEPWNKGMRTRPIVERGHRESRWGADYAEWHNECLRRDWYRCQICESKERLEVHHIKSYKDYPQERLNHENGITLCKKCHLGIHNFNVLNQQ